MTPIKSFKLKGGLYTLTSLQIFNADLQTFTSQLENIVKQTPKFFQSAPMVIDITELDTNSDSIDLTAINKMMRAQGLIPVGVRTTNETFKELTIAAGLALFPTSSTIEKGIETERSPTKMEQTNSFSTHSKANTKVVTQPVRSGQQIYSPNDLIILNAVSPGAEILADGNIHVYGPLRGRALAGIQGNYEARIFCQSLEAELISIAGHYLISESLQFLQANQYTQVYLEGEQLKIESL